MDKLPVRHDDEPARRARDIESSAHRTGPVNRISVLSRQTLTFQTSSNLQTVPMRAQ
jgi:hypothetical protein